MNNRRINIKDLELANDKHVLEVSVSYNEGGMSFFTGERTSRGIYLSVSPIEKSDGCRSFIIGGGPKGYKHCLEASERFNAKRLAKIAADISENGKDGEFGEIYEQILTAVLDQNGFVLALMPFEVYKPIELEVGQRVYFEKGRHGEKVFGYVVGFGERQGKKSYDVLTDEQQMFSSMSVDDSFQPIAAVEGSTNASVEIVYGLMDVYKATCRERDAEKARKDAESVALFEKTVAELKAKYPWAKQDGSRHARAAANLKTELQQAFPDTRFAVKSNSYSMGDSVSVNWTDGPTVKQVEEYSGKYQSSYLTEADMYSDGISHDSSEFGRAVAVVLGRAKHVSESRQVSDSAIQAVHGAVQKEYGGTSDLEWGHYNNPNRILERSEIYGEFERLENREKEVGFTAIFKKPVRVILIDVESFQIVADGVTVQENPEKGGVEIRFAGKPDETVRSDLKRHGFRWSKFQKIWYAKANDRTRAFANGLVSA